MVLTGLGRQGGGGDDTTITITTSGGGDATFLRLDDPGSLRLTTDTTPTTWETPDGSGVVVHPSVRFFPQGFEGYAWWAVATPYFESNNTIENPCLYVSENGINWAPPPGVTNPLVPTPGGTGVYHSDNVLVVDDGMLHVVFREASGTSERLLLISSGDGVTWSEPVEIMANDPNHTMPASPAVWFDVLTETWVMLAVDIKASPRVVVRYTADAIAGPWVLDDTVTFSPAWDTGRAPWHMDAQAVGSQIVAVVHETTIGGSGGGTCIAVSDDAGRTFTRAPSSIRAAGTYKSAALPVLTERGLGLELWTGLARSNWGVARQRAIRPDPVPDRLDVDLEMGLAAATISPYLACDSFDRADSTTGLGTATSGQAWTVHGGTLGIVSGWAVPPASGNNRATLDLGTPDAEISATFDTSAGSATRECWLTARYVDGGSLIRAGFLNGQWMIQRIAASVVTAITTGVFLPDAGDNRIALRCVGDQLALWLNGEQVAAVTETHNQAATRFGIQQVNTVTRIDDVLMRAL